MILLLLILAVALCVCVGGFFAGAETAMVSAPRAVLHTRAAKGDLRAALVQKILERPAQLLVTTLVGTNLSYVTATSLATLVASFVMPQSWHSIIVTAVMTPVILVCAELVPKSIGRGNALGYALAAAPWLWRAQRLLMPMVKAISALSSGALRLCGVRDNPQSLSVTREEVQALADISVEQGVIGKPEYKMIRRVFALNRTPLSAVMVPLAELDCVPSTASFADVILMAHAIRHSYLAVFEDKPDKVVGLVHIADVLDAVAQSLAGGSRVKLMDLVDRSVPFMPQATPVGAMLLNLQQRPASHVFAVDERGSVTGMIALQHIANAVIGDWVRARPQERPILKDKGGVVECDGRVDVDVIGERFGVSFDKDGYDTVGGLVLKCARRVPKAGESFPYAHLHITVLRATPKRVVTVSIARKQR